MRWYAETSDLTPIYTVKPHGTFTFVPPTPDQQYTLDEISDILNEALALQKVRLACLEQSFTILPIDATADHFGNRDPFGPGATSRIPLCERIVTLRNYEVADVVPELRRLLSPAGSVHALKSGNRMVVRDTAENVRRIETLMRAAETQMDE